MNGLIVVALVTSPLWLVAFPMVMFRASGLASREDEQ